jgi:transcriptional regulator GlxA family with amidase domain
VGPRVLARRVPSSSRVGKISVKSPSPDKEVEKRAATQPTSPMDELRRKRLGKILEIIKSGRPCTVAGLASEFNLSTSHLQHLFKRQTGLCLGHLLIEQKLQRAAHLLKSSRMLIKQIACAVGYQHTSSFIRAFERRFTEPPQVYRHHLQSPETLTQSPEMLTQSLETLMQWLEMLIKSGFS